jgi:hypothetical protein
MAIKKTIEIDVNTGKAVASTQALNKEINKTNKEVTSTKENLSGVTSVADGATGGAISKFQGLTGVIGNVSKGFTTLRGAIIASGIGALVVIIASVISAFSASEEGQNKFAKLMGVIGSVVGNVMDVISDLGEIIIGVLSGDSKAIKSATDFGKKIFDVVGLPIKNIIDIVTTAGKVLGALFSGDVKGALDNLKQGISDVKGNFTEAGNAINSAKNSLKQFGEEALREAKIAQQIADQRAKADKTERELIVQRAEGDRKIAELREKAVQRDTYNASQRIAMLKEAQAIETNLTNQEIAVAKLRAEAKTKENALSKSNKEALLEEENLKAKVIQLETQRLQGNRRLVSQIQALQSEENSIRKAAFDERKKQLEDETKKVLEEKKKQVDALTGIEKKYFDNIRDLQAKTDSDRLELERKRAQEELDLINLSAEEKAKAQELINQNFAIKSEALERTRLENISKIQDEFAPQFNVVGNTGVNQIAETLATQEPQRAYVVSNDVTSQQALDRNIVQNATLG